MWRLYQRVKSNYSFSRKSMMREEDEQVPIADHVGVGKIKRCQSARKQRKLMVANGRFGEDEAFNMLGKYSWIQ